MQCPGSVKLVKEKTRLGDCLSNLFDMLSVLEHSKKPGGKANYTKWKKAVGNAKHL